MCLQIELIGCTGAGKTTLARRLIAAGRREGIPVFAEDQFLLQRFGLQWLPARRLRKVAVDLLSLTACLVQWRNHRAIGKLIVSTIWSLPVSGRQKLHLLRITLKKLGTHALLRIAGSAEQIVLVDEGTLLIANNLFVHCHLPLDTRNVLTFAGLVPLPDAAIYIRERHSVLVGRTVRRAHKRIQEGSASQASVFLRHAATLFETVTHHPALRDRVLVLEEGHTLVRPLQSATRLPSIIADMLVRADLARDRNSSDRLEQKCPQ